MTLVETRPAPAALATLPGPDKPVALVRFGDALYVGTAAPDPMGRGRIWRMPWPAGGAAEIVYEGADGSAVTDFAVFESQGTPVLYAATAALGGGLLLASRDGRGFGPVAPAGLGQSGNLWLGPLAIAGGRLVVAAGSAAPLDPEASGARLLASPDPESAVWTALAEPGFGDAENSAIAALLATGAGLVAATANPLRGFQLWQMDPGGGWTRRLTDGAARFSMNPAATALSAGEGELLIGTGAPARPEAEDAAGPAAPEVIALDDGGAWETLVGEPRFSPEGFKVPFALQAAGFGQRETACVTAILTGPGGALTVVVTAVTGATPGPFGQPGLGASRLWRSLDGGESFAEVPAPGPVLAALATPEGGVLAVAGDAGAALHLHALA